MSESPKSGGNRILLVLPLYGMVYAEWVQQFLKFQQSLARFNAERKLGFAGIISTITPYVDFAMNELVNVALTEDSWDYMVVLEQDNIAPPGLMERVYNYDTSVHHVVSTLYFGRVQDDQRPIAGFYDRDKVFDRMSPDATEDALREPGLYEVDWVGMGCTAIHRSVFTSWPKRKLPWFINPQRRGKAMGHDVNFCTGAKDLGCRVWVDTREVAAHIGMWRSTTETYLATRRYNKEIGTGWDPSNISTSMSKAELERLAELARGKRVLEIGSRVGASTVAMARTAEMVHSVDWHQGDKWHDAVGGQGDTLGAFWATVNFHQLRDKVVPLVGRSQDTLPQLASEQFDLVFIDGDHSYEGVKFDLTQALRLVKPGGEIALHDYKREEQVPNPQPHEHVIDFKSGEYALGITRAVDESGHPIEELVDTLAVLRPAGARLEAAVG